MIQNFLYNLSYRKSNENDLSDITWTMCETSEKFKELFLKFFFPNVDFSNIITFEREKTKGNSRVDFYIETFDNKGNNKIYLIEVKRYDGNHHFEQYLKEFSISENQLGYITNYHCNKEGFEVKNWEEFYNYIKENLPQDNSEKEFWKGYLRYLKNVCRTEIKFKTKFYKTTIKSNYIGHYFEIEYINSNIKKTWAWIGIYYDRKEPIICLSFDNSESWGRPIYNILNKNIQKINEGNLAKKPYCEDSSIWFDMKNEDFEKAKTPEEQMEILKDFIDEVVTIPLTL